MAADEDILLECFVIIHAPVAEPFLLRYDRIREAQLGDARLHDLRKTRPASYAERQLE